MTHHSHVTHENGALGVDGHRLAVVVLGQAEPLLLVVSQADAVPCIVVTRISTDGSAETIQRLVQLLNHDVLVAE